MKKSSFVFLIIGIIAFLVFINLFDFGSKAITITAGVAFLMAFYWITETLPLSITSLIPLIIFPLTGVLSASKISEAYINSIIFLFIGGFLIAIAIEQWNLHKRIALNIIIFFGNKPAKILLGFMIASAFLSMWISNTATALLMLPIAFSIFKEFSNDSIISQNFSKAILLGIAYSCSIGGIATLVGTQPNLVLVRVAKITFPESPQINFVDWMIMALPISLLILMLTYFILLISFNVSINQILDGKLSQKSFLISEYKKLGPVTFEEKTTAIVFVTTIILWLTRTDIDIGFIKLIGWANLLNIKDYVDDSTVAILSAFILFIIPAKNSSSFKTLLTIESISKVPWHIILLFGGGFALATAFIESGLSGLIGSKLKKLAYLDILFLIFIISLSINFLTEFTSNTAVTQMILPILASTSITINLHPFLLMIPATLASSMAFMLPVGTPPNTIVFSSTLDGFNNRLKIIDMVRTGFLINIVSTIVITLIVYYWGNFIFALKSLPNWIK